MATLAHLPLHGIKVLELEGLAPSVFTGMVLADFGAEVTLINRLTSTSPVAHSQEELYVNRGKKSIALDLKNAQDLSILKQMLTKADVLVDAYRPGVLESLGLGF
jgi:alpha-methylacyl-CoA racemase